MALVDVKCPNCSAPLKVSDADVTTVCEYCRSTVRVRYTEDDRIRAAADRLAADGDKFVKLRDFDTADTCYKQLSNVHPTDWRGWWGQFVCITECFTKYPCGYSALNTYAATARRAIALSPASKTAGLQRTFDNFTQRMKLYEQNQSLKERMRSTAAQREEALSEQESLSEIAFSGRNRQRMRRTCGLILTIGILGALYCVLFRWNDPNDFLWFLVLAGCVTAAIIAGTRMRNRTTRGEGARARAKEHEANAAKARFNGFSAEYDALEAQSAALIAEAAKLGGMLN